MSVEKGPDYDIPTMPATEREKTIEQLRLEEESRIREIEQQIDGWARQFFAILKDNFSATQETKPDLENLDQNKIDQLLQSFPKELVKTKHDLMYFLSRALKSFAKANTDFKNAEGGTSLCYRENKNTLYSLVAKALGRKEEDIEKFIYSKPIFYREDSDALQVLQIAEDTRKKLPPSFFQNPTKFVERLNLVERGEKEFARDIDDLAGAPYDFTRVKRYKKLVFKRVDLSKVNYGTEEIDEAQKIAGLLSDLGDQRIRVQNFVGFIYDQGNIYLVSEFIEGRNTQDVINEYGARANYEKGRYGGYFYEASEGREIVKKIEEHLESHHIDIAERNIIIDFKLGKEFIDPNSVKTMTIIDFETKKL